MTLRMPRARTMEWWASVVLLEEELKGHLYSVLYKKKRYHTLLTAFYQFHRHFRLNWIVGMSLLSIVDSVGTYFTPSNFYFIFKFPALSLTASKLSLPNAPYVFILRKWIFPLLMIQTQLILWLNNRGLLSHFIDPSGVLLILIYHQI